MFAPAGTRLVYVADFDGSAFVITSVSSLIQEVGATLKNNFNIQIESSRQNGFAGLGTGNVTLTLNLISNMDRGNGSDGVQDIQGNVDMAFQTAGSWGVSTAVINSRITSYTLPKAQLTQTGAPPPPPVQVNVATDAANAVKNLLGVDTTNPDGSKKTSWLDDLITKLEFAGAGLLLGAVAVVGFIIFIVVEEK